MELGALSAPVLDPLTGAMGASGGSSPSLSQTAQEFESVFLAMLLKQMRQTLGDEGLFPGDSSDTLGGIFDLQMASHLSQQGGIGLAESLQSYLRQDGDG